MLEGYIKEIVTVVPPPWNLVAGVAALILLNLNSLIGIRDRWRSSYTETRKLEHEKLYLEVLKLRRELQISESTEYVPDVVPRIARERGSIRIDPRPPVVAEVFEAPSKPTSPGSVRRFVAKHPRLGPALMLIAQVVLVPLIAFLGLATVGIIIVGFTETDIGVGAAIVMAIVYAALTWLSYRGFRAAASVRTDAAVP